MNDFTYYAPTAYTFGRDAEKQAGTLSARYLGNKVLIVIGGGSVRRSGLLDIVTASLSDAGVAYGILEGIRPNPVDGPVPQLAPASDAAAAYRLVYARIDALLQARGRVAELAVPACPDWTIRQTLAHLTGVAQDVVAGNMADKAGGSWTRAQLVSWASTVSTSCSTVGTAAESGDRVARVRPAGVNRPAGVRHAHPRARYPWRAGRFRLAHRRSGGEGGVGIFDDDGRPDPARPVAGTATGHPRDRGRPAR